MRPHSLWTIPEFCQGELNPFPNVQKVSSTLTFSPSINSKFSIFLRSCFVWVNGSKRLTSSCRVILHMILWYLNNFCLKNSIKSRFQSSRRLVKAKYQIFSPNLWILKLDVRSEVDEQTMSLTYIQAFLLPEDEVTEEIIFFFVSHPLLKNVIHCDIMSERFMSFY